MGAEQQKNKVTAEGRLAAATSNPSPPPGSAFSNIASHDSAAEGSKDQAR